MTHTFVLHDGHSHVAGHGGSLLAFQELSRALQQASFDSYTAISLPFL
jgi:hypothetical protein